MASETFPRAILAAIAVPVIAFAQSAPALISSSGSVPVSPSVIATDMCSADSEGYGTLDLLVLWRGTPGWFRGDNGGSGGASGSGGGGRTRGASESDVRTTWLSEGGVNLSVRFSPSARKAWIQDREIDLGDGNVVLVDDVNAKAGPQVSRVLRIDPSYRAMRSIAPDPNRGGQWIAGKPQPPTVQTFIRRSPELIEYLRCDVGLPGAPREETQVFERWCRMLGLE